MVVRSRGALSKKTKKLRARKKITVTDHMRSFSIGDKVVLQPAPVRAGLPNPRYANRSGKVVEKRGTSYVVRIRDGGMFKNIIANPVHIRLAK